MIYIAYGSNINLEQMARRCPTAEKMTTGFIPNYELEFRGVATIVPKKKRKCTRAFVGYKAVGLDTAHLENALARSIEFGEQNKQLSFYDGGIKL